MAKRLVTLKDVVAGHLSLEIEGFDRIYLNGWVPALQTPGQVAGWLHYLGFPIASPAALGKIKQQFTQAARRYAQHNGIPWVTFAKGDRKIDVIRPYLDAAQQAGVSKVAAIGEAREFQWVFDATQKQGPDGVPWFMYYRTGRLVTCYYFYIWDDRCGSGFIKICTYAPYPVKVWLNGHDIARRKAIAAGIDVTPLANGFASASDPARLQELCDWVQAGTLQVFFDQWMARIPVPLTPADRDHGCWWQLPMRQVEVSRTLVFDDPRRVRTVFEELLAGNMSLGRAENVQVVFGAKVARPENWEFATRLLNRADQVTVNLGFKHSRIKIYLKDDRALRIETVINDPGDVGCKRSLEHLDELSAKARACNARLMDAVIAGQGCGILNSRPGLRHPRESSLRADRAAIRGCGGTKGPGHAVREPPGAGPRRLPGGVGDDRLRHHEEPARLDDRAARHPLQQQLGTPYSMSQASYDLARLRRNGLIQRIPHSNAYRLTADGLTFALVYSRVHDKVQHPLTARDQPIAAPADVRAAWRTVTRHIDSTVAATRLGRAA